MVMRNVLTTARIQLPAARRVAKCIQCQHRQDDILYGRRPYSSAAVESDENGHTSIRIRRYVPQEQDLRIRRLLIPTGDQSTDGSTQSTNENVHTRQEEQTRWKSLMRTLNKPVAIVTARVQNRSDDRGGLVAATVSSFVSVSIEPEISISFNLTKDSSTYKALQSSLYFCLTFPQSTTRGSDLAEHLSKNNIEPGLSRLKDGTQLQLVSMPLPTRVNDDCAELPKYMPAAIALSSLAQYHASGLAFAVTCKYSSSTEAGDHVIVVGQVLLETLRSGLPHGWGMDNVYGKAYSTDHVTLGHVHGRFTATESAMDVNNFAIGISEQARHWVRASSSVEKRASLRQQIEAQLRTILQAQALKKGAFGIVPKYSGDDVRRASDLPWHKLRSWERYCMLCLTRLNILDGKTRHTDSNLVETKVRTEKEEPVESESEQTPQFSLSGWQHMFVRNRVALPETEINDEIEMCEKRLSSLRSQQTEGEPKTNSLMDTDTSKDELNTSLPTRLEELTSYFSTRLSLLHEVTRRRASRGGQALDDRVFHLNQQTEHTNELRHYLHTLAGKPFEALCQTYERLSIKIARTEIRRLTLHKRRVNRPLVLMAELRTSLLLYYNQRDLLVKVIAKKAAEKSPSDQRAIAHIEGLVREERLTEQTEPALPGRKVFRFDDNQANAQGLRAEELHELMSHPLPDFLNAKAQLDPDPGWTDSDAVFWRRYIDDVMDREIDRHFKNNGVFSKGNRKEQHKNLQTGNDLQHKAKDIEEGSNPQSGEPRKTSRADSHLKVLRHFEGEIPSSDDMVDLGDLRKGDDR